VEGTWKEGEGGRQGGRERAGRGERKRRERRGREERNAERAERRREDDEWERCMRWVLEELKEGDSLHLLHVISCCGNTQCTGENPGNLSFGT